MTVKLAPTLLHFDLSGLSPDHEYTLLAGGGRKLVLKRYADHGSKLDEHRSRNRVLAALPEHRVTALTHFVDDAPMNATKASLRRIVFPSLDDHPLPEIAMVFPHVPAAHVAIQHHRFYRHGRTPTMPYGMGAYGVEDEHHLQLRRDLASEDLVAMYADAMTVQPPGVTAQSIALNHPELGSVNPGVMGFVKEEYLNPLTNPDMSDFVQYLQRTQPGASFTWYNKSWVMWATNQDGSGPLIPADVNTDLEYQGGEKIDSWPTPPGSANPGMPTYNLTDEYDPPNGNPANEGVIEAAGPTVRGALLATKNEPAMNGLLWNKQDGVTAAPPAAPIVVNAPDPVPSPVKSAALASTALTDSAAQGFAVKNQTSSYGLYLYDLAFDAGAKSVTLPVKNWPSRYLGAYVQFFKQDGTAILRKDIPGWPDHVPLDFVRPFVESSDSKNYLTWLSAGNAIFGVPVPPLTQTADLTFPWPDAASKALVLLGGLGCASGFRDWDSSVDIVGLLGTCVVNYGVGVLTLLADVYIVNPFLKALSGDNAVAFYAVAGVIGASALVLGIAFKDTSTGKAILSKLGGIAAGAVFGQIAPRLIVAGAKQYIKVFTEAAAETVAEMTAEEALEEVPVAGWALRVASVAADIAALAATTVECLASPATYSLEILRTMDLTVTVKPDPTHGKDQFKPIWPAVSDHYVIQVKYPAAPGSDGGTTYTRAGPMPGQHDADIVVAFPGLPAGGKIEIVASIYSQNDWLAGVWNSGWIDAVPDANDQIAAGGSIVELLVPLTATTSYSQKQTIGYNAASKHFWNVSQFTVLPALVPDFDKGGTPDTAIGTAFTDNGNPLSANASIAVDTTGTHWTLTDPDSGAVYDIKARQVSCAQVFTLPLVGNQAALDAGGAVPSSISSVFDAKQYPLAAGTQITIVTPGQHWLFAVPGQLPQYQLDTDGTNIDVKQTGYVLDVQNTAQAAPPLPQQYPLSTSPSGNALGALQNIIVNDREFQLGYAYLASGQNMPIDDQSGPTQQPMYAMQSVSTLGQPQEQIIQPTKGFSQPTFLAYDQFGLTPLFSLDWKYEPELKGGAVPADIAAQFTAFGYPLSATATVTTVTAGKDWTIGEPGAGPDYELRATTDRDAAGNTVQQVGVFDFPVPGIDNFFLEPQAKVQGQPLDFYLRGVKLDTPPGEYTFDYTSAASPDVWGVFRNATPFQEVAVHPNGYVVALDNTNAKMFTLKLPATALPPDQAPLAMPLAGKGGLQGLLDSPQAMTITADGRILILETGTQYIQYPRIQAFDVKGNPVPSFAVDQPSFPIATDATTIAGQLDALEVSPELLQLFQQGIMPVIAPKAVMTQSFSGVTADLDRQSVDAALIATLQQFGLAGAGATAADFTVTVTTPGSLWFVTDTTSHATYDVRVVEDPNTGFDTLDIFLQFGLSIVVRSLGTDWKIEDSVNAMTFEISKDPKAATLTVQQLSSWMPLRQQTVTGSLAYLDVATETKGYIYVLGVIDNNYNVSRDPAALVFQLDIYNPDGTPLLTCPQTGLNAGKITVDQYRSLFSLDFNVVIGPDTRTEPGVSQWIPSTPTPAT